MPLIVIVLALNAFGWFTIYHVGERAMYSYRIQTSVSARTSTESQPVMAVTTDEKRLRYIANENRYETLGLREQPSGSSERIARLERGTEVRVLEEGASATIDGISSVWVQVEVLSGEYKGRKGWLFKGYLD